MLGSILTTNWLLTCGEPSCTSALAAVGVADEVSGVFEVSGVKVSGVRSGTEVPGVGEVSGVKVSGVRLGVAEVEGVEVSGVSEPVAVGVAEAIGVKASGVRSLPVAGVAVLGVPVRAPGTIVIEPVAVADKSGVPLWVTGIGVREAVALKSGVPVGRTAARVWLGVGVPVRTPGHIVSVAGVRVLVLVGPPCWPLEAPATAGRAIPMVLKIRLLAGLMSAMAREVVSGPISWGSVTMFSTYLTAPLQPGSNWSLMFFQVRLRRG